MLLKRPGAQRGYADHGWLQTHHSFSFGRYFDSKYTQFRALRVINEDYIAAGRGFGEHPHDNMEILTCVLSGSLAHRDSMGTGSVIKPGDMQRMYAGTGVTHSEFNASETQPVHLMQIWLLPTCFDRPPEYSQHTFAAETQAGQLQCLAACDAREGSIKIYADAALYRGQYLPGQQQRIAIAPGRALWVQILRGSLRADNELFAVGDGVGVTDAAELAIEGVEDSDILVFDLG